MLRESQNPHSQARSHAGSRLVWGSKASVFQCGVTDVSDRARADLFRGKSALGLTRSKHPEAEDPLPDRVLTEHLDSALHVGLKQALPQPEEERV